MELWIRSQNRSQLAKITGLLLLDKEIRGFTNTEYFYELGIYKTKERALEVLDEIQKILNPMLIFKNCNCTKDVLDSIKETNACIVSDNARIEQINTCIYEMPQE